MLLKTFDKYIVAGTTLNRKTIKNLVQDLSFIENLEFRKSIEKDLKKFWVKRRIKDTKVYQENISVIKDIIANYYGF